MEIERLKEYEKKLMFEMSDEEYVILQQEFETFLNQVNLFEHVKGLENVEPLTFPFTTCQATLREDEAEESLEIDEVLKNSDSSYLSQVRIPKVVD